MDPEHPFFAPELEAAVALWLELFRNRQQTDLVAHKPTMELWLKENRHETLSIGGKGKRRHFLQDVLLGEQCARL